MEKQKYNPEYLNDNFYWEYVLGLKKPVDLCGWLVEQGLNEQEASELVLEVQRLNEESKARLSQTKGRFISPEDSIGRKQFESNL